MRRFLDWTAAQTAGGGSQFSTNAASSSSSSSLSTTTNRRNSQHQGHHLHSNAPSAATTMQHQSQQQYLQQSLNPARDLEIQHLTKLLHEIKYYQASSSPLPSAASSQNQREFVEKVHRTLPLFLNVFGNALPSHSSSTSSSSSFHMAGVSCQSSVDQLENSRSGSTTSSKPNSPLPSSQVGSQMERFPDLLPFAFTIARLFVSEVRQRASNKHAEDASLAILQFLNIKPPISAMPIIGSKSAIPSGTATPETIDNNNRSGIQSTQQDTSSIINNETAQGWNLLLSLNTLACSQSSQIIQLLCDASLPSTLIKCLYLFFDLPANIKPPTTSSDKDPGVDTNQANTSGGDEPSVSGSTVIFAREITSGPLIKAFTQLLVQLCSNQMAIDELIKKDDLRLLIGIASSQCAPHNRPWRKTAFQTLLAISRHMRDNFMYLEQNLCIQIYVDNMHRINSLGLASTEEFVDMIKTLMEFLYNLDVNNRNQPNSNVAPIVEQFKSSRIIDLIEELIVKIDETIMQECQNMSPMISGNGGDSDLHNYPISQQPSVSSEFGICIDDFRRYGRRLIQCLAIMAKINVSQSAMTSIINLKPLTMSRFEMLEQFKMPRPSARNCILNYEALRLFKMAWSKCQDSHIIEAILDTTISLFNDDKFNYFIFESQQLLVYYMTSYNFKLFPYRIRQKLFKFLEFIIIETNYIPCLELGTLGTIIKNKSSSDVDLILGLRTLIACLGFNSKFSDISREIGLLEVVVDRLIETMQQDELNQNASKLEVLYLLLEASQHLLAGPNNLNCTQFNESGAARHVFNCLSKPEFFHLFVPVHSSSSDDSTTAPPPNSSNSKTFTPTSAKPKPHPRQSLNATVTSPSSVHWSDPTIGGILGQNKPSIKQLETVAFTIIRQLILSTAGDEHLANLLGLLARNLDDLKSYECSETQETATTLAVTDSCDEDNSKQSAQLPKKLNYAFILSQEVDLKICILKSLMIILKDSHRCRTLFRKAGGFIYIVSSLVTLEKSLPSITDETESGGGRWKSVSSRRIWRLIKNSLMTIVVAIRLEPANLRAFSENVLDKFTESIRKLGCFQASQKSIPETSSTASGSTYHHNHNEHFETYKSIFVAPPSRDFSTLAKESIEPRIACCQLFRYLYDMSLDMGDGTATLALQLERHSSHFRTTPQHHTHHSVPPSCSHGTKSMSFDHGTPMLSAMSTKESGIFKRRSQRNMAPKRPPSLDLNAAGNLETAVLTYPCIVVILLDLIPSCPDEDLMAFICLVMRTLFKNERNQQLLCEAGMIGKLLSENWRLSITDKGHFLHEHVEFMLERLTKQMVTPKELRMLLRLGDPLKCENLDEIEVTESYDETRKKLTESKDLLLQLSAAAESEGEPKREKIPTDRIEALVAMMSDDRTKVEPPFVEFDLSTDGFSCIFMPSIAPVNAKSLPQNSSSFLNSTLDVHTNEKNGILGGVGSNERQFPPIHGFTFSTWICIEKFPDRSSDASHNLRLLTIYRGSAATGKEFSCFRMQISALDRALTVSTQEALLFDQNENRPDAQLDADCNLRIWTPELLLEGKWHHIAVTMNRSLVKQSTMHVFVDGLLVHSQRICYISSYVGAPNSGPLGNSVANNNVNCSAAAYVNAFIGSLPQRRFQLRTQWKQGPCHLIEETLSPSFIGVIYALGPSFIGNFQSSQKLFEVAKTKGVAQQQIQFDLKYNHIHGAEAVHAGGHKPVAHQHSVAIVHSTPLLRVSSANVGLGTTNSGHHHSASGSQTNYNLAEDRLMMSIDARATSLMTLSRMRRIYTRFDCRQVSRVLGLALHENSTPILLLHNTGLHLNGSSRSIGAITIGHNHVRCFVPSPTQQTIFNLGGSYILIGLVAQAQTVASFATSLNALVCALKNNSILQAQMDQINGYQILSVLYWKKKHLLDAQTLKLTFSLITDNPATRTSNYLSSSSPAAASAPLKGIQQVGALRDLICECFDLWLQTDMIDLVLEFIYELISSNPSGVNRVDQSIATNLASLPNSTRLKNLKCLREMDLLPRMLRLLPQYDSLQVDSSVVLGSSSGEIILNNSTDQRTSQQSAEPSRAFNTKAVYLIKQTVFELLNRTPRQSDILYFGQFVASLLPSNKNNKERPLESIKLRNILLKSLMQMMTKNNQKEINNAMQVELVRILGFDWFMLFLNGCHLDLETITIGTLNLMIVLSNDDLYASFKNKNYANGGWLKEPTFPTMDSKFNIQLLGINVGVFFGLSEKRKSIRQEVLNAPNFFLLTQCLTSLIELPRVYLMLFQTMMGRLTRLDSTVLDEIETFDELTLDILCDSLVGDTHHKRRQTLSGTQFKCHELTVCLVYMLRAIMWQHDDDETDGGNCKPNLGDNARLDSNNSEQRAKLHSYHNYPTDVIRFLMYLYNNNQEFQQYCRRSDELIDALAGCLMRRPPPPNNDLKYETTCPRSMTQHPASKEVLELSRLIILDTMTDVALINESLGSFEQLHALERFLDSLASCREAQGELVDMLLRQVLLMIDSTARHNSIRTIGSSDNVVHFQLLLINSISITQIVTDKIWHKQLYPDNWSRVLTIIDHQLCLAEQIFKFNELLPNHAPPHAFVMQRVLNRIILFALSRPKQHISDKMIMLDLLKKIYDNRTIIILNHMHSPQSAEFFVCLSYCLMNIIEENSISINSNQGQQSQQQQVDSQPSSLIERQYGNPPSLSSSNRSSLVDHPSTNANSSSALMLVSLARKVWDAIYQSKKGILSEAFDVSLSLPAFTLDTSLDLIQLKPDIIDSCQRYWSVFVEAEQRTPLRRRVQQRPSETTQGGTAATTAVNILSGRLTRVVNAANFVSRVVGATAGMASNVNLVGEKLSQQRNNRANNLARSSTDTSGGGGGATGGASNQATGGAAGGVHQSQPGGAQVPSSSVSGAGGSASGDQSIELFKCTTLDRREIVEATQVHIFIIEDFIESQLTQKNHRLALHKYLCDEWLDVEDEILLRERAIFGPDYGSQLDKWCLDLTEGPRRMRKKMVNNTKQFYGNYPYEPDQYNPSNKSLRYRPPMSYDSYMYYMKTHQMDEHLLELNDRPPLGRSGKAIGSCGASSVDGGGGADVKLAEIGGSRSVTPVPVDNALDKNKDLQGATSKAEVEPSPTINVNSPSPTIKLSSTHQSSLSSRSSMENLSQSPNLQQSNQDSIAGGRLVAEPPGSPRPPSDSDLDDGDSTSFVDFSPEIEAETNSARESENIDSLSVLRLLEKNERISHMFRCSRVQGLDTYEGLMLFGREHFYLIDGFTLLKTREIKDIDSLPPDAHDPIIPNSTPNILAHSKKTCAKFSFDSVVEVHKRRYLLQPIALEVFSSDGRNTLIVFPRNIRNKVYSRLMTVSTQLTNNAHESLAGQKSNVSVEGGSGLLSNLIGETSVTQRWVRGELSNFQYLMNLNTIAGRSYNDLMQYPIFPWILADYTSDSLDLQQRSTFRDLSRPVGAQTSDRLEQFKRRYDDWDDTETPPYHYGTFYSSAMIVASYMVRMEPFTQHFLRLQGGHFDLADRMFHSVSDSWMSASKHNMADIKELVPEFFYLPEFLKNENKFDLGIKQNGRKLNNVILPPWAKNDAREFIRLHRCALESDYVSAHLNEWIDLIFGYKQQGQAAVDAVNVFHHLFYEGNVDIYNTDIDPIKKNAVIGFINNFGQVPKQLFKKPHPARKVVPSSSSSSSLGGGGYSQPCNPSMPLGPSLLPSLSAGPNFNASQRLLTRCPQSLRQSNVTFKELRGPVGQIVQIDKNIVAVEQNKLLIPPEYCRYIAWGHADRSLRLGLYDSEKPIFVWEGSDNMAPNEILSCTIPNSRTMVTAGTDSLITVWKIDKMRSYAPLMNLYGHVEPVTCLASSQAYSVLVSGSRDRTAIIWDLNRFTFVRQLGGGGPEQELIHQGPVSAIAINDSTGDIATCASSWLYLWTINGELLAQVDSLVSSSISLQQSMCGLGNVVPSSGGGGGGGQLHILSVCFSQYNEWDLDEVIVTGASDGSVALWSMRYCQIPMNEKEIEEANLAQQMMQKDNDDVKTTTSATATNNASQEGSKDIMDQQEGDSFSKQEDRSCQGDDNGNEDDYEGATGVNPMDKDDDDGPDGAQNSLVASSSPTKPSDPINIQQHQYQHGGRKRTSTMNSEWVRLSASSGSTTDTMPDMRATTPTPSPSMKDQSFGHDLVGSSDSFAVESSYLLNRKDKDSAMGDEENSRPLMCSTPVKSNATDMASSNNNNINGDSSKPNQGTATSQLDSIGNLSSSNNCDDVVDGQSMSSHANLYLIPNDPSLLKFSKSDTSLVDSFVIVGDTSGSKNHPSNQMNNNNKGGSSNGGGSRSVGGDRVRPQSSTGAHPSPNASGGGSYRARGKLVSGHNQAHQHHQPNRNANKLLPNHYWKRELFLRAILPRRNGKNLPAAVTSLAISKDHRTLFVGDTSGRISSWTTT